MSLHTATFPRSNTELARMDSASIGPDEKPAGGGVSQSDETSKLSFMKKNESLNSNFDFKTPHEGGLTKAINNFIGNKF